jgi:phage gp36-like protein
VAYSTQADLENAAGGADRLAELTDLDGSGSGEVDEEVLASAIADADALIDTYVGRNRAVPLQAPIPRMITRVSADEAVFVLRLRRQMVGDFERERHADNLGWLEQVAKGFVTLGVEPAPLKSSLVRPAVVEVADDGREDTRAALKGLW